jgi:ADP-ribosylation factor GTPase-activating protein 1
MLSVQIGESDFAAQARRTAQNIGQNANQTFNRFVEGDPSSHNAGGSRARGDSSSKSPVDPEKKDFWDSFGESPQGPPAEKKDFWESFGAAPKGPPAEKKDFWESFGAPAAPAKPAGGKSSGNVGTAAMRKPAAGGKKDEDWGEW